MQFPSKLIEEAVNEISKLPGIGKKTALRLALYLLKQKKEETKNLANALVNLRNKTTYCNTCFMISDTTECTCRSIKKDHTIICVVEDTPDILAIENTSQYQGMYHVLGGVIPPIDGIGPDELQIESLIKRVNEDPGIKEIILALSPTLEGDTTSFYISRKLKNHDVRISTIARGIPVGGELEFTDEITLGRSILNRISYTH